MTHKFGLFFILSVLCRILQGQIAEIAPPNWWPGMQNPLLQVMVKGENISSFTPVIRAEGITLQSVHKAESKNYLFLDLIFSPKIKAGSFRIEFQKNGKTAFHYDYPVYDRKNPSRIKGFDASDVVYLITPDRFANGNPSNDSMTGMLENEVNRNKEGERHGGDIRGMIDHLDYIAAMGFTAIWPTPLLENNMPDYSYHGYAITHHYKPDPRFGTMEDYKELAQKAREKGIKLIFDGVINHTGSYHWWMKDLPFKDWINYPDSARMTSHRRTVNQDLYASQYDYEDMTKGWFVGTMPDMNGLNPFLANYLIQNSIWWIETLGLGGIRQDTYGYSDKKFLKEWSCRIMAEYPEFSIVGEEWSLNPLITAYWQKGKKNQDGYEGCLKSIMDFPLQHALVKALNEPESNDYTKGLPRLYEALANDFVYADPKNILIFGDNHDMDRLFTQLHHDVDLTEMALTYLLTTRGIPQVYYGTEVLMENSAHPDNHGYIRSDFPGGWKEDVVNGFTGKGLTTDQIRIQSFLRQMLNWRKNASVIHQGKTLHFAPFQNMYVYFRFTEKEMVMVVMNKNSAPMPLDTRRLAEILKGKTTAKAVFSGKTSSLSEGLTVPPKSAVIFELY
ncbi:MAG: glycoside hydrolase family 13 protein [Bacteroidia bacterium]|nr:glycoside hydrolase family 13 protein [Bacteroidia bacterium]